MIDMNESHLKKANAKEKTLEKLKCRFYPTIIHVASLKISNSELFSKYDDLCFEKNEAMRILKYRPRQTLK